MAARTFMTIGNRVHLRFFYSPPHRTSRASVVAMTASRLAVSAIEGEGFRGRD
jgi:hypothetical protein